ncbi:hypothetical protein EJ04DRAFT_560490 [Polyplosphaeria fusca]|uniref:DNA-directed RNA polymerase subunit n=1 Tax=Polyplosphaeria fusca TaxID=682080 RepID=A0A9P4V7V8_9PLEO|nr:hypothetical protein EJ04DRAFT_560490 [Polyplosphaeria fusca]
MLLFCPHCGNMLRVGKVLPGDPSTAEHVGKQTFTCLTCPYEFIITQRWYDRKYNTNKKEPDDIVGGENAWDNVQTQDNVLCPSDTCDGDKAFWYQLQIRSADEPMTTFYRCTECHKEWRE